MNNNLRPHDKLTQLIVKKCFPDRKVVLLQRPLPDAIVINFEDKRAVAIEVYIKRERATGKYRTGITDESYHRQGYDDVIHFIVDATECVGPTSREIYDEIDKAYDMYESDNSDWRDEINISDELKCTLQLMKLTG